MLQVLPVLLAKTDLRGLVEMRDPQEDRETLDSVELRANRERKESLEKMGHL